MNLKQFNPTPIMKRKISVGLRGKINTMRLNNGNPQR